MLSDEICFILKSYTLKTRIVENDTKQIVDYK